jgi:hypothetical protein
MEVQTPTALRNLCDGSAGARLRCSTAVWSKSHAGSQRASGASCIGPLAPDSAGSLWEHMACADILSPARDKMSCAVSEMSPR